MIQQLNHTERQNALHSTDIASILGLPGAKGTGKTVWLEKSGRVEPWAGSKSTDSGKRLESTVLDYAEDVLGPLERNVRCVASGLDFPLVATLDGRVIATRKPVEAKTTGIVGPVFGDWGAELTDEIPQLYLVQTTVQMICDEAELNHVFALIGGRGYVEYRVARDEEVARAILENAGNWWHRHIEQGVEPTDSEPVPMEIVKRIRRQPKKTISLTDDALPIVAEYQNAQSLNSSAGKALAAAQSNLIMLLQDAESGVLPDGRQVNYLTQKRRGYYADETEFRVLRIKKG